MITAVKKVIEAEKKADDIIAEAQKEKGKILEKARHDALQLISDAQKKIDDEQDAFLHQREKEIDEKKQRILDAAAQTIAALERRAEGQLKKAEALILKKFKESIEPRP